MNTIIRCPWAKRPEEISYHDHEWGRAEHDDNVLFEFLILEGMQAGLSWITILRKRENFRRALDDFNPFKISLYTQDKIDLCMQDASIIRNRIKLEAAVKNAKAYLDVCKRYGSFDQYIWRFVEGKTIVNSWRTMEEMPSNTKLSDMISKEMKRDGFSFVGSTIVYSFMQAVGMVNDHLCDCAVYHELTEGKPFNII